MIPDANQVFIQLWQQGTSQQEMAARLGVPLGTIKSRAAALARQGKLQPRPRGGAYPRQQALARQEAIIPPVSTPVQVPTLPPLPQS